MAKTIDERDPETLLPLTPAVFHILLALAGASMHGYAISPGIAMRSTAPQAWRSSGSTPYSICSNRHLKPTYGHARRS